MRNTLLLLCACLLSPTAVRADGPGDNLPDKVRRVPPPGIKVPEADRQELQAGVAELGTAIAGLRNSLKTKAGLLALLPDVEIFHKAVHDALKYEEFFNAREINVARNLLKLGKERATQLAKGEAPWTRATGLVVRGYVSKIDGSVQPYGLVVPASYQPNYPHRYRLDFWCHGRGETLSELSFLNGRLNSPGEFTPPNAFVLHLYGRYCCANKFAGEVDLFEAYHHVRQHYPIDENRLVIRGFSMGGAACWQFAVHYPGMWAAAAPGAGFSETPEFLRVFQNEKVQPTEYEKKLWHLYDCTDYALNLYNCPTVAYSGEIDSQKQAADIMAKALTVEGMTLTHIIGPKTRHSYHPQAKLEVDRRINALVGKGRNPTPRSVRFTTWTLRYNQCLWLTVEGLGEHWERARVEAEIANRSTIRVKTSNVTALTLNMNAGQCPLDVTVIPTVVLDGQEVKGAPVQTDRSWVSHFRRSNDKWTCVETLDDGKLAKRPGLQGPIDDAFWDRFLMVRPTGKALNEKVGTWATAEMNHATEHWRRQFRGEAPIKDDRAVSDADLASSNLILWGDPSSNAVLARLVDKLPVRWTRDGIQVGDRSYPATQHVPVLIYPNPLNPKRYVVLNSGFTFREYDYLNNARQVPKLPDYAVIDVSVPVNSRAPGKVVQAGFFDEQWRVRAK